MVVVVLWVEKEEEEHDPLTTAPQLPSSVAVEFDSKRRSRAPRRSRGRTMIGTHSKNTIVDALVVLWLLWLLLQIVMRTQPPLLESIHCQQSPSRYQPPPPVYCEVPRQCTELAKREDALLLLSSSRHHATRKKTTRPSSFSCGCLFDDQQLPHDSRLGNDATSHS